MRALSFDYRSWLRITLKLIVVIGRASKPTCAANIHLLSFFVQFSKSAISPPLFTPCWQLHPSSKADFSSPSHRRLTIHGVTISIDQSYTAPLYLLHRGQILPNRQFLLALGDVYVQGLQVLYDAASVPRRANRLHTAALVVIAIGALLIQLNFPFLDDGVVLLSQARRSRLIMHGGVVPDGGLVGLSYGLASGCEVG